MECQQGFHHCSSVFTAQALTFQHFDEQNRKYSQTESELLPIRTTPYEFSFGKAYFQGPC